jgi:hypothetical protein
MIGPPQIQWGTVSSLTLPAGNGTWSVALVASSKDKALRPLRELDRWQAVMRSLPLAAHWLDGTPIDDGLQVPARLAEIEAGMRGEPYDSPDPWFQLEKALDAAAGQDPDCQRALLDIRLVLRGPDEVFARPGLRERTLRLGAGSREEPPLGPDRGQLLALVSAP